MTRYSQYTVLALSDMIRFVISRTGLQPVISFRYPEIDRRWRVRFEKTFRDIEARRWEPNPISFLIRNVKSGEIVIDVGAWVGPYALLLSHLVGSRGRVVAFEPDPVARTNLSENLRLNSVKNVSVEPYCVSNLEGMVTLQSPRRLGGSLSTILPLRGKPGSTSLEVEAVTLDGYLGLHRIRPTWMKIDVEGAELQVFESMEATLGANEMKILLEFHGGFMSSAFRKRAWAAVTKRAEEIIFLQGESARYSPDDEVPVGAKPPDSIVCNLFVRCHPL